jgi:hypothetical protein
MFQMSLRGEEMAVPSFSDTAWVEIQGDQALHLVQRTGDYAEYEIIGYGHEITLRDFRSIGLAAIDRALTTGKIGEFFHEFNTPALVNISDIYAPNLAIDLHNTHDTDPSNRLWIAIGTTEVPVYEYFHKRVVPYNDSFALVAVYHRNPPRQMLSPDSLPVDVL